ncbi:hypothetical protein ABS71_22880 [bacterium SCN 62-11]|nr:MAG: hypothetical protein ABS71_22880 [bacterium SCN 62-11]
MAYYRDLTPCDYFHGKGLTAVGWLEPEHAFEAGPVPPPFLDALRRLLAFPWFPFGMAGPHQCGFCKSVYGSENLLVPGAYELYASPAMILHYIEVHQYRPPQVFQEAVLACPATHTKAYFDRIEGSRFLAACEKICPGLRGYHAKASRRFQDMRDSIS